MAKSVPSCFVATALAWTGTNEQTFTVPAGATRIVFQSVGTVDVTWVQATGSSTVTYVLKCQKDARPAGTLELRGQEIPLEAMIWSGTNGARLEAFYETSSDLA